MKVVYGFGCLFEMFFSYLVYLNGAFVSEERIMDYGHTIDDHIFLFE